MQDRLSSRSNPSVYCLSARQWDLPRDAVGQLRLCNHFKPPGMRFKLKYFSPPDESKNTQLRWLSWCVVSEEKVKHMSFCLVLHHEKLAQATGLGDLSSPGVPAEQGDLGAGSALFGHQARCLPVRAVRIAGCGTSCPPSDAKGRFPALELTLGVFPGAAQFPSSAQATAGGRQLQARATTTHSCAARRAKSHHPGRLLLPWLSLCLSTSSQIPIDFYIMIHISILEMLRLLLWSLIETTWGIGAPSANSSSHKLLTSFSFRFYICPMFYPLGEFVIPN